MGSNFHYTIDLNEDQNHHTFFSPLGSSLHHNQHIHQVPNFNPSSSSSSLTSPSLSYHPFLINSHQDQVHVGYNNNTFQGFLDPFISQQPLLQTKKFVSIDGESSSSDQMVPKKETRIKLTIRKKDNHQNQTHLPQYPTKGETETTSLKWISSKVRMMKRKATISTTDINKQHVNDNQYSNPSRLKEDDHVKKILTTPYDIIVNENGYNGSNTCVIRICSDCNTTKTPLWRSGPRGPKSLCNACGIRQRKARQAAKAAATANIATNVLPPLLKKKMMQKKNKGLDGESTFSSSAPMLKTNKRMTTSEEAQIAFGDWQSQSKSAISSSSTTSSSNKLYSDDLAIILSKSSAYQQFFPPDEKEAAILLMALSYGMVHG